MILLGKVVHEEVKGFMKMIDNDHLEIRDCPLNFSLIHWVKLQMHQMLEVFFRL